MVDPLSRAFAALAEPYEVKATTWIERDRREAEERYRRLDAVLADRTSEEEQKGSAS